MQLKGSSNDVRCLIWAVSACLDTCSVCQHSHSFPLRLVIDIYIAQMKSWFNKVYGQLQSKLRTIPTSLRARNCSTYCKSSIPFDCSSPTVMRICLGGVSYTCIMLGRYKTHHPQRQMPFSIANNRWSTFIITKYKYWLGWVEKVKHMNCLINQILLKHYIYTKSFLFGWVSLLEGVRVCMRWWSPDQTCAWVVHVPFIPL